MSEIPRHDLPCTPTEGSPSLWYHFLRATGLQLLARIPLVRRKAWAETERPKPIIRQSFGTAAVRLSVHVTPVLTSAAIISLNFRHIYLGRNIPGPAIDNTISIALFQVCAKLHELLIVASLTTIVMTVIRDQLMYGAGLPLGFLCSGFTFSQLNYFWSEEYWGALTAKIPRRKKTVTAALLFAAGLIAATAGPASAVLMVPRQQSWKGGGSEFYLRGNMSELFPTKLSALPSHMNPECLGRNAPSHAMCPSAGLSFLSDHTSFLPIVKNGANLLPPPESIFGDFATVSVQIPSLTDGTLRPQLWGSVRGIACQTAVLAPYLAATAYQDALKSDWDIIVGQIPWDVSRASQVEYKYNSGWTLETLTRVPAVRAACSVAQNVSATQRALSFPVMPEYSCWNESRSTIIHKLSERPSDTVRVTWTPLPQEFGSTSTGLIVEAPWIGNGSSRIVVGCSVDARWADGAVDGTEGHVLNAAPSGRWGRVAGLDTPFQPPDDASWSEIELDESWLHALTPIKESPGTTSNLTTFEFALANSPIADDSLISAQDPTAAWNNAATGSPNRTLYLEWISAVLIANGVSRYGSDKALNTSGPKYDWSLLDYNKRADFKHQLVAGGTALRPPNASSFTTFYLALEIEGLSYRAQSVTDYLAAAVLLAHILLALGHSAYLIWTGKSSAAWDSIIELLALVQNSRPSAHALRNTSGGIKCLQTYRKVAAIRATNASRDIYPSDGQAVIVLLEDIEPPPMSQGVCSGQPTAASTWPRLKNQPFDTEVQLQTRPHASSNDIALKSQKTHQFSTGSYIASGDTSQRQAYTNITPDHLYS